MALAFFLVLVVVGVVAIGFMIYGVFLGLARLADHVKRLWLYVTADASAERQLVAMEIEALEGIAAAQPAGHCWEIKECLDGFRGECPAARRLDLPCWLALMQANPDGHVNARCLACKLFNVKTYLARA